MSLFDWFQPQEPDTTTFEISNDNGDQIVFTIPTKGSNKIRQALRNAGLTRNQDYPALFMSLVSQAEITPHPSSS